MKRQATEEQRARAKERRAKFKELAKKVGNLTAEQRAKMLPAAGAVLTVEGRALSGCNTMLCVLQFPGVSMVGGFRQWLKAGRCVKKGESGLCIWVPVGKGKDCTLPADAPEGTQTDGERPGFICGTVFDISQTAELENTPQAKAFAASAAVLPVEVVESKIYIEQTEETKAADVLHAAGLGKSVFSQKEWSAWKS